MSLKLFRSTGYSSILVPGETRVAMHPGWVVLATSLWIGFVCNVGLWRELLPGGEGGRGLPWAAATSAFTAAASGVVLSLFGWRRTFKATATLMLALAALVACALWAQSLPLDASLLDRGARSLLPVWPNLLRWQVPALLTALGLLPMLWLWHAQLRRLPGPEQLAANATGMVIGGAVFAVTGWLLLRGL